MGALGGSKTGGAAQTSSMGSQGNGLGSLVGNYLSSPPSGTSFNGSNASIVSGTGGLLSGGDATAGAAGLAGF